MSGAIALSLSRPVFEPEMVKNEETVALRRLKFSHSCGKLLTPQTMNEFVCWCAVSLLAVTDENHYTASQPRRTRNFTPSRDKTV